MSLKSQSAMEFIILASFMVLVILGFFAVTSSRVLEAREEGNRKIAEDIADLAYREIEIAKTVSDGYIRIFSMPQTINGIGYSISLIDDRELLVDYLGYEYVRFLPTNVTGNVSRGLNQLEKKDGVVYINNVIEYIECSDGIDNDDDNRIDLNDVGCSNAFDQDESNCGDNSCEGGESCSSCSADCGICLVRILSMKNSISSIISFYNTGNVILKGTLEKTSNPPIGADEEFIFKDRNGNQVAVINLITGNMFVIGDMFQNQPTLAPSASSNNFVVRDSSNNIISYIDESGNFYLKGSLTQNGNP